MNEQQKSCKNKDLAKVEGQTYKRRHFVFSRDNHLKSFTTSALSSWAGSSVVLPEK